jgi:hypothetical protein
MSQFEYLSVLVSIIVGLAITQLLSGAARRGPNRTPSS